MGGGNEFKGFGGGEGIQIQREGVEKGVKKKERRRKRRKEEKKKGGKRKRKGEEKMGEGK